MNNKLTNYLRKTYQDRFKRYLILSLIILGVALLFTGQEATKPTGGEGLEVHFFYLPGCSHCDEQKPFNEKLANTYSSIDFIYHNATKPEESALLSQMLTSMGVSKTGFPVTIFGAQVFSSWESEETTGKEIEDALQKCLAGDCRETQSQKPKDGIILPIIGKVIPSEYSLPALAAILGLIDGFNPCAMWVLAYLISLIITLRDKRRIWLLVGSFVLASGILYFLFMTVWLNAFLLIGYLKPLTIVIGLIALGGGILSIREFIKMKGAIVCEVGDEKSKKKTMSRMEKVVFSPLTLGTVAGIVALAFVVNSIEFVCSAAIPAIFTYVLSLSDLSTFQYYAYILLYCFFFMLDDLIIFSSVAFAMTSGLGDRYVKYCRPIGGVILAILGALLIFAPDLLR
ncbi:MAG: hypothetical protein SU899_04740 [Chloroflexota bacterium]|nr:hypothetical protein [Chloroflexota bacterium]